MSYSMLYPLDTQRTAVFASPGDLLEVQSLRPYPRPTKSESVPYLHPQVIWPHCSMNAGVLSALFTSVSSVPRTVCGT